MSLNLSIVCHDRSLSQEGQADSAVRAIGEILPFILAKYGVEATAAKRNQEPDPRAARSTSRFQNGGEARKF